MFGTLRVYWQIIVRKWISDLMQRVQQRNVRGFTFAKPKNKVCLYVCVLSTSRSRQYYTSLLCFFDASIASARFDNSDCTYTNEISISTCILILPTAPWTFSSRILFDVCWTQVQKTLRGKREALKGFFAFTTGLFSSAQLPRVVFEFFLQRSSTRYLTESSMPYNRPATSQSGWRAQLRSRGLHNTIFLPSCTVQAPATLFRIFCRVQRRESLRQINVWRCLNQDQLHGGHVGHSSDWNLWFFSSVALATIAEAWFAIVWILFDNSV